jgi:flagellar biosynthetic protein FliR
MQWAESVLFDQLLVFTLVLSRVGGLVMTAPAIASPNVPRQARAFLAVAMAALVMPLVWGQAAPAVGNVLNLLVLVGIESLVGVALGLGVTLLFAGIQLAAQVIGTVSGMQMAEVYNPLSDSNAPVFAEILFYVAVAVFVMIGGHRQLFGALLDTFVWMPPGAAGLPTGLTDTMIGLVAESFQLAIRAAAPTLTALLVANLVLGLVSRALPQINVNVIGFALNSLLTLSMLSLSLGAIAWIFQEQVDPTLRQLLDVFQGTLATASGDR